MFADYYSKVFGRFALSVVSCNESR